MPVFSHMTGNSAKIALRRPPGARYFLSRLKALPISQIFRESAMALKVVIGMSGGVDSSVSAYLLKKAGFDVTGLFMKNWEEDDTDTYCSAAKDRADAESVCRSLDIPLKTINFSAEYWDDVFENFLSEYKAGRTPNPDVLCNREIKFKAFMEHALEDLGGDYIATGHYVRRSDVTELSEDYVRSLDTSIDAMRTRVRMLRASDLSKDQTYFLNEVSFRNIGRTLFPVGALMKRTEVRKIAEELGLATAKKKDSTGICFIGEKRFKEFLSQYLPAKPGKIVTDDGKVLGQHDGLMYYTLGQRNGIELGGIKGYPEKPWFVLDKDLENNLLVVGQDAEHPLLMNRGFITERPFFVDETPRHRMFRCGVKIRYRHPDDPCRVFPRPDGTLAVLFDSPVSAVTPGQSAVFYDGEVCLGGAVINKRIRLDDTDTAADIEKQAAQQTENGLNG